MTGQQVVCHLIHTRCVLGSSLFEDPGGVLGPQLRGVPGTSKGPSSICLSSRTLAPLLQAGFPGGRGMDSLPPPPVSPSPGESGTPPTDYGIHSLPPLPWIRG